MFIIIYWFELRWFQHVIFITYNSNSIKKISLAQKSCSIKVSRSGVIFEGYQEAHLQKHIDHAKFYDNI